MIAYHIQDFCSKFSIERNGAFKHSLATDLLTKEAPLDILSFLDLHETEYIVRGSVGQGNWAEIPWLAILDRGVTTSTKNGYYIALLISADLQYLFISLGLGWTQFYERYGTKTGLSKIASCGYMLSKKLVLEDEDYTERIDLAAKSERGRGYEAGNICARKYQIKAMYNEEIYDAIELYLDYYTQLINEVGADVFFDEPDNQLSLEKDEQTIEIDKKIRRLSGQYDKSKALIEIKTIADTLPPKKREYIQKRAIRNKAFADYVKLRANFICELCGRKPFLKRDGTPYAEADHVESLFAFGVDHPDNMRCLCAQCHRVVTYGSDVEIAKLGEI